MSGVHFAAGACSGLVSAVALQPLDLMKTRVQQSRADSLTSTLKHILGSKGAVRQLWKGTVPSALRTSMGSALYFTSLNWIREFLGTASRIQSRTSSLPLRSSYINLASGAIARAAVGFVMMPITIIKVRYESTFYAYRSLAYAAGDIYKREGPRGFFSGFGVTALRDAPYAGLYVLFYEKSKSGMASVVSSTSASLSGSVSASIHLASGASAAALATAITNPADMLKTRIQLQPTVYHNMLQATRKVYQIDGLRGFFDGLGLRMARKAFSSAIAWTLYEEILRRSRLTMRAI